MGLSAYFLFVSAAIVEVAVAAEMQAVDVATTDGMPMFVATFAPSLLIAAAVVVVPMENQT